MPIKPPVIRLWIQDVWIIILRNEYDVNERVVRVMLLVVIQMYRNY